MYSCFGMEQYTQQPSPLRVSPPTQVFWGVGDRASGRGILIMFLELKLHVYRPLFI